MCSGCQHISIEANYDNNRLWNGPYPMRLKDRIAGRGGHLSNDQTGQFLSHVVDKNTRSIVLTHLSEKTTLHTLLNQPFFTILMTCLKATFRSRFKTVLNSPSYRSNSNLNELPGRITSRMSPVRARHW